MIPEMPVSLGKLVETLPSSFLIVQPPCATEEYYMRHEVFFQVNVLMNLS